MKKILFLLSALALLLSLALPAEAQKVESRSRSLTIFEEPKAPKVHSPHRWVVSLGGGLSFGVDDYRVEDISRGTFLIDAAYEKYFPRSEFYWGVRFGLTNFVEYEWWTEDGFKYILSPYLGPIFGIDHPLNSDLSLDVHLFPAVQFAHRCTPEIVLRANVGAGVWFKRYYAGLEYAWTPEYNDYDIPCHNHVLIVLGIKF